MSYAAVGTNAALVCFTMGRTYFADSHSDCSARVVWVFLFLVFAVLQMMNVVAVIVPDEPESVRSGVEHTVCMCMCTCIRVRLWRDA